jgi:hypothetical protein
MRNRNRRAARPNLETVEPRVVPSAIGIHGRHMQDVAAHVGQVNRSIKQAEDFQRENEQALKRLQRQEHQVYVHSLERTPSALPTEAEKRASQVSDIFKSIGQGL